VTIRHVLVRDVAARISPSSISTRSLPATLQGSRDRRTPPPRPRTSTTHGSTGEPKGVVDSHRNVLHNVMRYTNGLASPNDRLTLLQSPSFSGAVSSMFCALLNGATSLPFRRSRSEHGDLADYVDTEGITSITRFRHFRPFCGAIGCSLAFRVVRWKEIDPRGWTSSSSGGTFSRLCAGNGLGATETGIVRRFLLGRETPLERGDRAHRLSGGRHGVVVVDEGRQAGGARRGGRDLGAPGVPALGYWNAGSHRGLRDRPGADGRLPAVIWPTPSDGCLEHLGRKDSRTKIRGVTVSLAEVEAALAGLSRSSRAAVIARTDATTSAGCSPTTFGGARSPA